MNKNRFYSFITIGLFVFLLTSCASQVATETNPTPKETQPVAETIAQSDSLFKQRGQDLDKLREAVKLLANLRNPDNRNYEVEWKFAQYNYFLGKHTDNKEESEKAFEDGEEAGRIASRMESEKPEGHFWYGANLGEQARRSPVTKGLTLIDDIQREMLKVVEVQPDYQNGSAYDALGQLELSTSGLLGKGNPQKAVEYLEKALEIEKENSYIRLHLAQAYLAVKRDSDARKQLDYLLQMKPNPEYIYEYNETRAEAKKLLETRF